MDHQRRFLRERSCFILSQAAELLLRPPTEICHLEDLSCSPDVVGQPRGSGNWLTISEPGDVGGGVTFDGAAYKKRDDIRGTAKPHIPGALMRVSMALGIVHMSRSY